MARRTFNDICADVANARVRFPQTGGQGVLVANSCMITAAHCLKYNHNTGMRIALGDHVLYDVVTAQTERTKAEPLVIESCSDIAVLAAPDGDEYENYELFCERTRPVPLCRMRVSKFPSEFRVHILTHNKGWVTGKAAVYRDHQPTLWIEAEENIDGGTSGGPIINDAGELVGVVSIAGGSEARPRSGPCPSPRWALPSWVYNKICGIRSRTPDEGRLAVERMLANVSPQLTKQIGKLGRNTERR